MPPRHRKAASDTFAFSLNQLHEGHLLHTGLAGLLDETDGDTIPDELLNLFDSDEELEAIAQGHVPSVPELLRPITTGTGHDQDSKDTSGSGQAARGQSGSQNKISKLKELRELFKEDPDARFCMQTRGNALDPLALDPKRAKRIIANRQSAHRSRMKKLQYTHDLEKDIADTQGATSAMQTEVQRLGQAHVELVAAAESTRARVAELSARIAQQEGLAAALLDERARLKGIAHDMLQRKQAQRAAMAASAAGASGGGAQGTGRTASLPSAPQRPPPPPAGRAPQPPPPGMPAPAATMQPVGGPCSGSPHAPALGAGYTSMQMPGALAAPPMQHGVNAAQTAPLRPSDPSLPTFGSLSLGSMGGAPVPPAPTVTQPAVTGLGAELGSNSINPHLFDDGSLSVDLASDGFMPDDMLAGSGPLGSVSPAAAGGMGAGSHGMPLLPTPSYDGPIPVGGIQGAQQGGAGMSGHPHLQQGSLPGVAPLGAIHEQQVASPMQLDREGSTGLQGSMGSRLEQGLAQMPSDVSAGLGGMDMGALLPAPSGHDDLLMMLNDIR